MHELSICRSIAGIIEEQVSSGPYMGRVVERVRLQVGHLKQVVPETLRYSWNLVVAGTCLDGVLLDIDHVPARLFCRACAAETQLTVPVFRCGSCESTNTKLISGDELLVTTFDLAPLSGPGAVDDELDRIPDEELPQERQLQTAEEHR